MGDLRNAVKVRFAHDARLALWRSGALAQTSLKYLVQRERQERGKKQSELRTTKFNLSACRSTVQRKSALGIKSLEPAAID